MSTASKNSGQSREEYLIGTMPSENPTKQVTALFLFFIAFERNRDTIEIEKNVAPDKI